ncbi:ligand-binding sensor domain-containing protein [Arcticibacter eurypsychrophilus]|uniref:ligand-binding sensor domain-containing protein n=1 Tax=Arcticibacter eurypsychrophilus TaxID=1434752 RepID=UPI00084D5073|nr:triple tyrosine motif-containing protein [Arcticibacter eurypsychrophilus]
MFRRAGILLLWITCFLLINKLALGTDIKGMGVPYVQNYTKAQYLYGNQNWSVTKDQNGIMYYGNSEGLLSFDGRYWQQYRMPNHLIVRSVAADGKDRIYAGAFGEFGYWSYNKSGKLVYNSLTPLVPSKSIPKDEIWKIYVDGQRVIFQSFASIFIYEKGKISVVKASKPFLFLFKVKNRFFVEVIGTGLFELKGKILQLIPNSHILGGTGILTILPYQKSKFIIGTAKNGLYIYDGKSIIPWSNQANQFLKTFQLNNGLILMDRYFAFGTILNGIVILNESGQIVQQINKSSGLQNNTVLSLYSDNEQNLWAGLDNGIDRIELNSPLYFYFDKKGDLGTVYSSIIYKNKIYLGTNQGLFYSDLNADQNDKFQSFNFKFIPNSQGQVWDLSLLDDQLVCGHNEGTFAVVGESLKRLSSVNGGWTIKRLNLYPDMLIQGTYTGLVIYRKTSEGKWVFSHRVSGFGEPSRYVEQDAKGQIWVAHAYKGLYRLQLSSDLKSVVSSHYYGVKNGLPGSYHINVYNLDNRIVFSSDAGFYVYDDISNKFYKYSQLNTILGSFASSNKIIPAADKSYWFINHGSVALTSFKEPGKISVDSSRFTVLDGRMVQYYENISKINNSIYLISMDDGFAIYNGNTIPIADPLKIPKVLIRKVENITYGNFSITENGRDGEVEIPSNRNNIRITYALPYYRQAKVSYQFMLEGYTKRWSEWSPQASKEFTNLSQGTYVFKVRARINEKIISDTAIFEFIILPPWYLSTWAIIFYILLHIAAFLFLRRLYYMKLRNHQEEIHRKLKLEKEALLKQELISNDQKIAKLKNEQLQVDLESKSRELANSAMNIVYKNELLQKISDELIHLKDSHGKVLKEDQLKRIQKVIDEGINDERDWNVFEHSFNEAHENFFKKLKINSPDLVPNDLKLCAYLRMNMSSKEIASLLNISLRGVEIRRYRLRKKLNLDHDKNLSEFFIEL